MITDGQLAMDTTARKRATNQSGILVESPSGKIDSRLLNEVTQIPSQSKPKMIDFLRAIGIHKSSLFSDLDSFIHEGQEVISLEAQVHLWLSEIRGGNWENVLDQTATILSRTSESDQNHSAALYCCAIAAAGGGMIDTAWDLINRAKDGFAGRKLPTTFAQNLSTIHIAVRSRDKKRLARRIDKRPFSELWMMTLEGYKVKNTPTPEQARIIADEWQRNLKK